jgi:plastocyanin
MRKFLSALMLAAAVAACSDNGPEGVTVEVGDDTFSPSQLTVDVGTTVTWTWVGDQDHNVVFSGGNLSSPQQSSGTWSHTFNEVGGYSYTCTVHDGPDGEITVR